MDKKNIPSIKIRLSQGVAATEILQAAMSGLEEESVPYEVATGEEADCVRLAYRAAEESVLEVGIGIDGTGGLAVHYRKLPPDSPLFRVDYLRQGYMVRNLTANAARLIRGIPFILEEKE